jgi:Zn-dependent oligopeptidase
MILEPGGSQSEMETMTAFLGRAPDTRAFREEHGFNTPENFQANSSSA